MNTSRKAMEWIICFSLVNLMLGCILFEKIKKFNESCLLPKAARMPSTYLKVACRVQIWRKKHFVKIVTSLVKTDIMSMYMLYNKKKTVILSLFKTDTLNFTMYILTILTCPLKDTSLDYII